MTFAGRAEQGQVVSVSGGNVIKLSAPFLGNTQALQTILGSTVPLTGVEICVGNLFNKSVCQ